MDQVITFGCRLNAFESEVVAGNLKAAGDSDTIVFNTCAVTAEAERQARQAIRKARRARPEARIVVTGCAAQLRPEAFAAMPEVDRVVGNLEKLEAETFAAGQTARIVVRDIMTATETAGHLTAGFAGRARAFVQVQTGCDHRCTFCIIPYARGNSRSVPLSVIADQVRQLVAGGCREVVLTGVDLTAYGADLPGRPGLGQMVRRLLAAVPELPRLRLSSIDPSEVDPTLWRLIAEEPRLMAHLHLSLQAGDDLILKRMKRRHSRAQAIEFCAEARRRRPDIAFGADLIAGFPTETDQMFENTLDLVGECGLTWLHVFPYSPRPATPAARMPQVPVELRRTRAARLRAAGKAAEARFATAWIGRTAGALVEAPMRARTDQFAPVTLDRALPVGTVTRVAIADTDGGRMIGSVAP